MRVPFFFTLFVIHSLTISALDNEEDSSLSEELAPSRLVRSADAVGRKSESVVLQGEHCQYIDFANARSSGSGCVDGTKMVIKNKAGHRKQFLIADSRTIYGFVEKDDGKKFATNCSSYTDKTCDIQCKLVPGLSSISLSGSAKKKVLSRAQVYYGSNCEWIDLNKVLSDGIDCANGHKFVIKAQKDPQKGINRRQLLFVDGKTILAFVSRGSKFADCSSFTEVTTQVECKAVANLETVSLPSACSGGSTGGLIMAGGYGSVGVNKSVEVYVPSTGQHCQLPQLPTGRWDFSLEELVVCGGSTYIRHEPDRIDSTGSTCLTLTDGSWKRTTTLREWRVDHASWASPSGLMLLGGAPNYESVNTTEKILPNGTSIPGKFNLTYITGAACAINLGSTVLLTGGWDHLTRVSQYNEDGFMTNLKQLNKGRWWHGCSSYNNAEGTKTYLVTGGHGEGYQSSTELLVEDGSEWVFAGDLPSPRDGLKGANINNRVFMTGGFFDDGNMTIYDDILEFDPLTGNWTEVAKMKMPRSYHAVSMINFESKLCV